MRIPRAEHYDITVRSALGRGFACVAIRKKEGLSSPRVPAPKILGVRSRSAQNLVHSRYCQDGVFDTASAEKRCMKTSPFPRLASAPR